MWALGGGVVGASATGLFIQGADPNWVEAAGTWFGAIATVLALLWAVQTFRTDQASRDAEIQRREREGVAEAEALEVKLRSMAEKVVLELRGGGGHGTSPYQVMTSLHLLVHNDSDQRVSIHEIELDPLLRLKHALTFPVRVQSGETWRSTVDIEEVPAKPDELSDRPVPRFSGSVTYLINGQEWCHEVSGALFRVDA